MRALIVAAGDLDSLPAEIQTVANVLSAAGWTVRLCIGPDATRAGLLAAAGTEVDPDALVCKVKSPAGTTTTYTYGTTAFPVRATAGEYYVDVTPDVPGEWVYQFRSTGTGQAMDEGVFVVRESRI